MKQILFSTLFISFFLGIAQQNKNILENGNYLQYIEKLKKEAPTFDNLEELGTILQQTGKIKEAINVYNKALKIKSSNTLKIKLAKAYKTINKKGKAIEIYQNILIKQPNNLLLKYRLANLFYQNKYYKRSKILLSEISKTDKNNISILYKLASVHLLLKQPKKAIFWFQKIIDLDSLHYKTYYYLAKIYRKLKRKDSTAYFLEQGLKSDPNNLSLNQLQAKNAFQNLQFKKVILSVKRLDSLKLSSPFYQNLLGISYYQLKKYDRAKEVLTKLVLNQKIENNTFYYLGLVHQKLKNFSKAEKYFNMSIYSKKPKIEKEYFQLAMLYKTQKKPKQAIAYLKKSLKEKAYNADALYEMAFLTENYYKDKTIALKYYEIYISQFESSNPTRTKYVLQQIAKIKTDLFLSK